MKSKFIIDTHTHLGYWPTLSSTSRNLVESEKREHVNFTLVSFDGTEYITENKEKLVEQVVGTKKALSFARKNKGFGVLVWIRPKKENNYKEIDELIARNRNLIYGLKFHPACSRLKITSKKLVPYLKIALKYDLPVVVHTALDEYSSIIYLKTVCDKYPQIKFVAAHMELLSTHTYTIQRMRETPNLYGDTAWVKPTIIKKLIKYNLMDRVVFGTDNPIDGLYTLSNPMYQQYLHNKMHISKANIEKIMYKNAIDIFKINPKDFLK